MTPWTFIEFLLLAAIWGASFLAMQLSAREFGIFGMGFVRVLAAAAVLLPLLMLGGEGRVLRRHLKALLALGVINSAVPFTLNSWS
ncbi:MAG TPA: EamA family transporter, partial [Ramlibacter sp.]|nr:EamA family transporter [Ramlibacter sp.]